MALSLRMLGRVMPKPPWDDPNVFWQVIFSSERLESHAQRFAAAQVIRPHRQNGRPLLDRLADNATPHHVGNRGWTWYTGSAGWMQDAGLESILGLQCEGLSLHIDPCIPNSWPSVKIRLLRRSAQLHIKIENPEDVTRGVAAARMDGTLLTQRPLRFELADDRFTHELSITLG
jgi:cyclic beta-1,2-glucan synthetase